MKFQSLLFAAITAPLALAAPSATVDTPSKVLDDRQGCRVTTPVPCAYISPPPTEAETAARHALFFDAFINKKNLSEAFKYIDNVYRVHKHIPFPTAPLHGVEYLS
jgi:hypothetical protein